MKTIIQGKNIQTNYKVNTDTTLFGGEPCLRQRESTVSWSDIICIDGEIKYNSTKSGEAKKINLSETECVEIIEEMYRADLNAWVVRVNKTLSNEDVNKENAEAELAVVLKEYRKERIKNNPRMKAYCDLHQLVPEEVDLHDLEIVLGIDKKMIMTM